MTAFLRAYQQAEQCGVERPIYRDIGLGICDAALAVQKPDGRFEGPGCERGGIGAAFIPPLLTAFEMTRKPDYLEGAKFALRFYIEMLYRDGCLWGGALDTHSIDNVVDVPVSRPNFGQLVLDRVDAQPMSFLGGQRRHTRRGVGWF